MPFGGLGGLVQQLTGQPDVMEQLHQAMLAQAQQQQQPSAAPTAGPPTAAPAAAAGGAGGPAQAPQQQPTPQAYQSQGDFLGLYLKAQQQQTAAENFNRSIAGFASLYGAPSQQAAIRASGEGMTGPPVSDLFTNVMRLQQAQLGQQRFQATQAAVPGMLKGYGITDPSQVAFYQNNPDQLQTLIASHTAEGSYKSYLQAEDADLRNRGVDMSNPQAVAKAKLDFEQRVPLANAITPTGLDPELNAYNQEHNQWLATHGGQEPDDNRFSDPETLKNWKAHNASVNQAQNGANLTFPALNQQLVTQRQNAVDIQKSPDLPAVLTMANNPVALGVARSSQWLANRVPDNTPVIGGITQDQMDLLQKIDSLSSWDLSGLSHDNPHLVSNVVGLQSSLRPLQSFGVGPKNYNTAIGNVIHAIDSTRAQGIGASGQLDQADADTEGLIPRSYLAGGSNYIGEAKPVDDSVRKWAQAQLKQGGTPAEILQHMRIKGYNPKPGDVPGVI